MLMNVTALPLGDLTTNCYLVWDESTLEALIIDPADNGDFITDTILQHQLQPVAIVLTHGHFDHVLGLLEVSLNFPVPVLIHEADIFLIKQAQSSALHWLHRRVDPVPVPGGRIKENDIITFGHEELRIMETPGHTPGSICLYNDQAIFSGDTLFANGVGRTDFKYASSEQLQQSLQKIADTMPNVPIFPGHGEAVRLEEALTSTS